MNPYYRMAMYAILDAVDIYNQGKDGRHKKHFNECSDFLFGDRLDEYLELYETTGTLKAKTVRSLIGKDITPLKKELMYGSQER